MNNVKLLVLSDLHLERVNEIKQKFLLSAINEKVEQTKNAGFEPLVVFAGDINNSTKGYEFISKVNSQCVYVAGNHEFWGVDYYETLENLKAEAPANVNFLHNDLVSYGNYLILGSTLWTDIGQNLNKDLLKHAGSRMNDMAYIGARRWYENPENLSKLDTLYDGYNLEGRINNKKWNALVEIEENQKAWNFFENVDAVIRAIEIAKNVDERLSGDLKTKSDWWKITKTIFNNTKKKINIESDGLNWETFIANMASLYKNYSISEDNVNLFLKNKLERDVIFQKIRHLGDVSKKDIVILSHHLPFYEEILVGSIMQEYNNMPVSLHNEVDKDIFMVRSGIDYPGFNYIMRALKGDLERKNDITHIVNYYNDGTNNLPEFLLKNTKLWIHGHEHHFRHCEYVKGIQIVANPSGSSLSIFDTATGDIKLNSHYISYNKVKPENHEEEINKIKKGFVAETADFLTRQDLAKSVKIWALKHFKFEDYKQCLNKIYKAAQEILLLSVQYVQNENQQDEKQNITLQKIEEKISIWNDSYNYNCHKIKKMHDNLLLAFNVRVNNDFSFQTYSTNSLIINEDFYPWIMGNASPPQEINDGIIGVYSAKQSFEAKENIKIALKYIEKLEKFLDTVKILHIYQVRNEHKDTFDFLSQKTLSGWRVCEKIEDKWRLFYEKTLYGNIENKGLNLDNDF